MRGSSIISDLRNILVGIVKYRGYKFLDLVEITRPSCNMNSSCNYIVVIASSSYDYIVVTKSYSCDSVIVAMN